MTVYSLSDARARLPLLLDKAAAGETVVISRQGHAVAVLVGHDRWMKTRTHDVLLQAREIRQQIEEARAQPLPSFSDVSDWDVDAHISEIRQGRDRGPRDDSVLE